MDLKGSGLSNKKKVREEDESDAPKKDKKSEGEDKSVKFELCNEYQSDSYKGLAKVDGSGKGSEVRITENINDDTSLDACKGPPTLEVGKNSGS